MKAAGPALEIERLRVSFHGDDGRTTCAVDGVDLTVRRGQTLGLVGESGCGKSVTALAIMGLLPRDSATVSGRIHFERTDLLNLPDVTDEEIYQLSLARQPRGASEAEQNSALLKPFQQMMLSSTVKTFAGIENLERRWTGIVLYLI